MTIQDGKFEQDEKQNPFAIQLEAPMQQIAPRGVCEAKPYYGNDSRGLSAFGG